CTDTAFGSFGSISRAIGYRSRRALILATLVLAACEAPAGDSGRLRAGALHGERPSRRVHRRWTLQKMDTVFLSTFDAPSIFVSSLSMSAAGSGWVCLGLVAAW